MNNYKTRNMLIESFENSIKEMGHKTVKREAIETITSCRGGAMFQREFRIAFNHVFHDQVSISFGQWLDLQIRDQGKSRVMAAQELGVSHQSISLWISGKSKLGGHYLFAIIRLVADWREVSTNIISAEVEKVI